MKGDALTNCWRLGARGYVHKGIMGGGRRLKTGEHDGLAVVFKEAGARQGEELRVCNQIQGRDVSATVLSSRA